MKRFVICVMSLLAVITCVVVAVGSYDKVTVSDDVKAEASYDECEVHVYDTDYYVVSEPTCSSVGMKWRACSVCGKKDIVQTAKDPDNHTDISDEWVYFPSPTCASGGTKYKVCYGCNSSVEVTDVPADPDAHTASDETVVLTEATCVSQGVIADVCVDCGKIFNERASLIDAQNHHVDDDSRWEFTALPTCSEPGVSVGYCDYCNEPAVTKEINPTGYHYHDDTLYVDIEATCSQSGVMSYHCSECGMPMEEQEIVLDPDAHTYTEDFVIDTPATCVSEGEKSKHCIYCDDRIEITTIPIDSEGHVYDDNWIVYKEATCSEMGLKYGICTLCGEASVPVATAKGDHSYSSDYEIVQMSSDSLSAKVKYTCTVCGYEKEDIVTFSQNDNEGDVGDGSASAKYFKLNSVADTVIVVDYENFIISNVARNMKISTFNSNFTNITSCVIYDTDSSLCSEESLIATGYRVNYEDIYGIVTNYYVSVTGDLDSDGKVTASDARLALRASASLETFTYSYFLAADVDSDGKITASDARKVLRVSANLEYFASTYKY